MFGYIFENQYEVVTRQHALPVFDLATIPSRVFRTTSSFGLSTIHGATRRFLGSRRCEDSHDVSLKVSVL